MPVLLERARELAVVAAAVRSAEAGSARLVVVEGSPGAGRSALMRAVAGPAGSRAMVLRADGAMLERDFSLGVIRQLLQPLLAGASDSRSGAWFAGAARPVQWMFPNRWPAGNDPDAARTLWSDLIAAGPVGPLSWDVVLRALTAFMENLSREQPVVLVIDDLQWADRSSLQWVGYLIRRLDRLPITVVCAVTDGVAPEDQGLVRDIVTRADHLLHLAPLSIPAVQQLISSVLETGCEHPFAAAVHLVTGGNPAALDVVLRGLQEQGFRPTAAQADKVEDAAQLMLRTRRMYYLGMQPALVGSVAAAMAALDVLSPRSTAPAELPVDADLVAALAGVDPLDYSRAVGSLQRLGLTRSDAGGLFVHPSVAEAVLWVMPIEERELLHRRAAALLHEAGFGLAEVAEQLLAITSGFSTKESGLLRAAAEAALERGAGRLAARYLRPVLFATPPDTHLRARLLVDVGIWA